MTDYQLKSDAKIALNTAAGQAWDILDRQECENGECQVEYKRGDFIVTIKIQRKGAAQLPIAGVEVR